MAFNFSPKIVTNGLVLSLDAANPKSYVSGSTVWNDLTSNATSGQLINGPTFSSANSGVIVFNGSNNYALVNNAFVDFSISSFSISYFFKINALPASFYSHVWIGGGSFSNSGNLNAGISMGINASSALGAQITDGSILRRISIASWGINTADFFNLTYVVDRVNNITKLYNNSKLIGSLDITGFGTCTTSKNIYIASEGGGQILNGIMNNFQIYNRVLSDTEILQNYNALKGRFGLT